MDAGLTALMSTVGIEFYDNLYSAIIDWVTDQHVVKNAHSLQARASMVLSWNYWDKIKSNIDPSYSFDLSDWGLKPPKYLPNYGKYFCWHDERTFWIGRYKEQVSSVDGSAKDKI